MLSAQLDRLRPYSYTALRIVAGLLFACHGAQKLFGVLGGHQVGLDSQMGLGGVIELGGGTLIALGLATRIAAFVASGQMAVAYIQFHWKGAFDGAFFPVVNKGELAVVYCFLFLMIACYGPGRASIDRLRGDTNAG